MIRTGDTSALLNTASSLSNVGTSTAPTLANYGATAAPNISSGIGANTISNLGANGTIEGMSTLGSSVAAEAGGLGSIGATGLGTVGSTTAATAGAGTAAGAGAGVAGGAAAGGTAAGAGASGAAAAAGPIGALIALGIAGLQGTNRNRSKQAANQLMSSTNNMSTQLLNDNPTRDFVNQQITNATNNIANNSLGQYGQGNIDLYNRPQVKMDDGSTATVRSMSFNDGKNEVLIPTVSDDGKIMSDEDAIKNYYNTGKYLGKFNNVEDANNYANQLHNEQDQYYNGKNAENNQGVLGEKPVLYDDDIQNYSSDVKAPESDYNGVTGFASDIPIDDYAAIDKAEQKYASKNSAIDSNSNLKPPVYAEDIQNAIQTGGVSKNQVSENQESKGQEPKENVKFRDKISNALNNFKLGYDENTNNAFDVGNLTNNQFATDEVLSTDYKAKANSPIYQQYVATLKNAKTPNGKPLYSDDVINAVAVGHNGGNKDVAKWVNKNLQNKDVYEPVNTYNTVDKTKMGRAGEFAGTLSRLAKNPHVQGLIAGVASTALTGNPLYGLGMYNKFDSMRTNSEMYKKILKEQGIDADIGTLGTLDSKDYNALMLPQYRDALIQNRAEYQDWLAEKSLREYQEKVKHNREMEKIGKTNANANVIRAKKTGNGKGGGKNTTTSSNSNGYVLMKSPTGKIYKVPENKIKKYKQLGGKIVG